MIVEDIRSIKSGKRELRQFGITISVALALVGCWFLWREKHGYLYLFITSLAFLVSGILFPLLLKPLQKLWMTLALLMGWVVTGVIMMALFYLVVTPIGIVVKLSGRDLLNRGFNRGVDSYWIPRGTTARSKDDYEKQY